MKPNYHYVPGGSGPAVAKAGQLDNANAFARMRLAQLSLMGYTPQMFGITGNNEAEIWRQMSPLMGATLAAQGGHADLYNPPPNMHPAIATMVQQLLAPPSSTPQPAPTRTGGPVAI